MTRCLTFLALVLPLSVFGAAGDITSLTIRPDGWSADLVIEGYTTNCAWEFGWTTNNSPENAKVVLTVHSPGFDSTGTSNWTARTVYGTKQVRFPYPSEAYADQQKSDTHVTNRIALSDWVYAGDGEITARLASGVYSNSAAWSGSVSNTSTANYPQVKVIGNWSEKGFRVIDGPVMTLRAVGFAAHAKEGKPLALCEFRVRDSAGTWVTNRQTEMRIDRRINDAVPVGEYVADFATNSFTGGLVTCDFRMYPWIGTADSILDSGTSGYVEPTPYPATLTNAIAIPRVRALVATNGSDSAGVAANATYWATNQSPPAFATIGRAMRALYDTNNTSYSRAGMGGGIVYLGEGNHSYLGSTLTLANAQDVETVVMPYPGLERSNVVISAPSTDQRGKDDSDKIRLYNLTLDSTNSTLFISCAQVWFDQCDVKNWSGTTIIQQTASGGTWILTHCTLSNITQGIRPYTTQALSPALVRGCQLQDGVASLLACTVVGNKRWAPAGGTFSILNDYSGMLSPRGFPFILAYNSFLNTSNSTVMTIGKVYPASNGCAIVQNLFMHASTNQTHLHSLFDGTLDSTNVIVWNNTVAGVRCNTGYNESGSSPVWRVGWSFLNNIFERKACKTDTFAPGNGARIGNWPLVWGVGHWGNAFVNTTNMGTAGAFDHEFPGVWSFEPLEATATNWWRPVLRGGNDGVTTWPGEGNFRLMSDSPLLERNATKWVLPFDLEGNARGDMDPPGAYASGNPRKGGGFF